MGWYVGRLHEPKTTPSKNTKKINGAYGYDWTTKKSVVLQDFYPDKKEKVTTSEIVLNRYLMGEKVPISSIRVFGKQADAEFLFGPGNRLIKITFKFPIRDFENCRKQFGTLEFFISAVYSLQPYRRKSNNPTNDNFCKAFRRGEASGITEWRDPGSNSRIILTMGTLSTNMIRVFVESERYYSYKEGVISSFWEWYGIDFG